MLISDPVKDGVKSVSQKEVIWNEEWESYYQIVFYQVQKDLISTYNRDHLWSILYVTIFIPNKSLR